MNFILLILIVRSTSGLTGYDCGEPHINISTISLPNVDECDIKGKDIKTKPTYVQLLQLADFEITSYIQCKVSVTRTVSYCGMHSHVSAMHNGYAEYT